MFAYTLGNSSKLIAFNLKKDKLWLPSWMITVIVFTVACAPLFPAVAGTPEEMAILAETMKNPVMIALCGPIYGDEYTYGIMYVQMMLVWVIMLIGVMNIFFIVRHTRRDEEDGKLEILQSLPIGRMSNLFSVTILSFIINLITALLTGIGLSLLGIEGMDVSGCMLLGLAIGLCGLFFAAVTAIFAQLSSTAKGTSGLAIGLLAFFYLLRAAGDMRNESLSLFTPFGLAAKVQFFYKDNVWPLWILLAVSIVLFMVAFMLNKTRDLGASLLPDSKGRKHAKKSLRGPLSLSMRLVKTTLIAWIVVIVVFAASYGSVFEDLTSFYESNELFKSLMGLQGGSEDLTKSFLATLMLIMSLIAVIPVLTIVFRLRSEEKKGRLEQVYANAVSKQRNMLSYLGIAIATIIILQLLCALSMWATSHAVMKDPLDISYFIKSAINFMPPMFFFAGLSVLLVGAFPKGTLIASIYLAICFMLSYLGDVAGLPKWTANLSVFGVISHYPAESFEPLSALVLIIIAAILAIAGIAAYQRRDIV